MKTAAIRTLAAASLGYALALGLGPATVAMAEEPVDADHQRQEMVRIIEAETRATAPETGISQLHPKVLEAMARVPRHAFLPDELRPFAYLPTPLPVTEDQNIAAPFLVALMTHLADIQPDDRVFETGTGAGYHAAVLAELASEVFSVEVIEFLARRADGILEDLGYGRVQVRAGDGYYGWSEAAPFDVIIVKEALNHLPDPLLRQLRPGGRMIVPLGPLDRSQVLTLVEKSSEGRLRSRGILAVKFSPLQGGERL
ncbi:MAG: protein-L-isoaspartate(D-aspartate) O-methyltransferase [Kiloniellales bacterium]|nr:protein-L-isoaspartate(D-aspartate) O-methyltransferase [Kiloniellales bacterium]